MTYLEFKKRVLMYHVTKYRELEALPEPVCMALWFKFKAIAPEALPQSTALVFSAGVTLKEAVDVLALAFNVEMGAGVTVRSESYSITSLPADCVDENAVMQVLIRAAESAALPHKGWTETATGMAGSAFLGEPEPNAERWQFGLAGAKIAVDEIDRCYSRLIIPTFGVGITAVASLTDGYQLSEHNFSGAALTAAVAAACMETAYAKAEGLGACTLLIAPDWLEHTAHSVGFVLPTAVETNADVQCLETSEVNPTCSASPVPAVAAEDGEVTEQKPDLSFGGTLSIAACFEEFEEFAIGDIAVACNLAIKADCLGFEDFALSAEIQLSPDAAIAHDYVTHDEAELSQNAGMDAVTKAALLGTLDQTLAGNAGLGCLVTVDMARKAAVVDFAGASVESLSGTSVEDTAYIK